MQMQLNISIKKMTRNKNKNIRNNPNQPNKECPREFLSFQNDGIAQSQVYQSS